MRGQQLNPMLLIWEFARLGQVTPRTLRHYDEIGLLRPEAVEATNGLAPLQPGAARPTPPHRPL